MMSFDQCKSDIYGGLPVVFLCHPAPINRAIHDRVEVKYLYWFDCEIIHISYMSRYRARVMALLRSEFSLLRDKGYIGGKWIGTEKTFPVYNPATGEELGQVADMGQKEAELAVKEAYKAFQTWKKTTAKVCKNLQIIPLF